MIRIQTTGWQGILLAGLLLSSGCGRKPHIAGLTSQSVIVAFGDSLTFGSGADEQNSYPALLKGLLGCTVVNAGNPGELSSEGLDRLPGVLDQYRPSLLLLCHGGNDFLRKNPEEETRSHVRAMVSLAREREIDVVLIGVPKPGLWLSSASFYRDIAEEFALPYEGKAVAEVLSSGSMKSDYVHPNEAGYRAIAAAVADLITRSSQ